MGSTGAVGWHINTPNRDEFGAAALAAACRSANSSTTGTQFGCAPVDCADNREYDNQENVVSTILKTLVKALKCVSTVRLVSMPQLWLLFFAILTCAPDEALAVDQNLEGRGCAVEGASLRQVRYCDNLEGGGTITTGLFRCDKAHGMQANKLFRRKEFVWRSVGTKLTYGPCTMDSNGYYNESSSPARARCATPEQQDQQFRITDQRNCCPCNYWIGKECTGGYRC